MNYDHNCLHYDHVGVTEEIMFRGYAMKRFEAGTASTWLAGIITITVFLLIHGITYSISEILGIAPLSGVLT